MSLLRPLLLAALLATPLVNACAENLVANAGFEESMTGWTVFVPADSAAHAPQASVEEGGAHEGRFAARLRASASSRFAISSRAGVTVVPGERYRLSAWYRAEPGSLASPGTPGFLLRANFSGEKPGVDVPAGHLHIGPAGGVSAKPGRAIAVPALAEKWTHVEAVIEIPAETRRLNVNVFAWSITGTLWIDEIGLERVPSDTPLSPLADRAASAPPAAPSPAERPAERIPTAARMREIAGWLSARPTAPGRPIDDRAAWDAWRDADVAARYLKAAERDLAEPTPVLTKELFELYKTKGTRAEYELPFRQRSDRLARFTIAECLENRGRFLAAIETELAAILAEETWVAPAHWYGHGAERGVRVVDLASTARAWSLAVVDHWLGDRLRPGTRAAIRREAEVRIWRPYLESVRAGRPLQGLGWMRGTNNWNAVCHAGVIGSALSLLESREERAEFIAAGEIYLPFFLSGFTDDGYCSEGIGYWNYGFGSYLFLNEAVRQATGGRVDWLRDPKVRAIATYPARLEIFDGIYPTYADGAPGGGPSPWMKDYLERRLSLGHPGWLQARANDVPMYHPLGATLFGAGTILFLDRSTPAIVASQGKNGGSGLRDEFAQAQIFTLRPAPGQPRFGVSFKGGHNDEHHNHNDLGSFVVAAGKHTLLLDPGMETYTKKTFGPARYESRVLASYGHSVPLVAGRRQSPGRNFAARVLRREFSDTEDKVALDLADGYEVPTLAALERTFTYRRGAAPSLVVHDRVRFTDAEAFGTALITFSRMERAGADRLVFYEADTAVEVLIDTHGAAFALTDEVLPENLPGGGKARRIGIDLRAPAAAAEIALTIRPVEPPAAARSLVAILPEGIAIDAARPPVRVEAEARDVETGGRVDLVERVGSSGLGIRNWDGIGHTLGWTFRIGQAGRHALRLRYALGTPADSIRSALLDGKPLLTEIAPARFASTGGWSSEKNDWREVWLGGGAEATIVELAAGEHTLTLRNEQGPLNLDWVELVPVR